MGLRAVRCGMRGWGMCQSGFGSADNWTMNVVLFLTSDFGADSLLVIVLGGSDLWVGNDIS